MSLMMLKTHKVYPNMICFEGKLKETIDAPALPSP